MVLFSALAIAALAASVFFTPEEIFEKIFAAAMLIAAVEHFVILYKSRNPVYLVSALFYLLASSTYIIKMLGFMTVKNVLAAAASVFLVAFMYLLFTKRIKWYYKEILELAARPVEGTEDGFTGRPYPAGKADYTRDEILRFARFMGKHTVAVPMEDDDGVVLVIPKNILFFYLFPRKGFENSTYVSFGFDGRVSVNVAGRDYRKYREDLTFDRLCSSFVDMFRWFFDLHRRGKGGRILKALAHPFEAEVEPPAPAQGE